jgi:hypothetical protein
MPTNNSTLENNKGAITNGISIATDFGTNILAQIAKNAGPALNVLKANNAVLGATLDLIGGSVN